MRAAFNVRGASCGDYGDGELMSSLRLGTMHISALVHVDDTLRYCTHLQRAAILMFHRNIMHMTSIIRPKANYFS